MAIWPALLLAPVLALMDQAVAFAVTGHACATQSAWLVHLTHMLFLLGIFALGGLAWTPFRASLAQGNTRSQAGFVARVAFPVACLSSLGVLWMWLPVWLISPCIS